jgi:hypothetical protein
MHIILTSLSLFILLTQSTNACLGPFAEKSIFTESRPSSISKNEALVKATIFSLYPVRSAIVTKVYYSSSKSIKVGSQVILDYEESSCGPSHRIGESGIIRAKIVGSGDQMKLSPYFYKRYPNIK